jgi:hypothetical protein
MQVVLGISMLGLLLIGGCARQALPRDEGGIVGSGTKINCQQQPRHPSCEQNIQ